ncbi:MAG: FKBP-type peptidyl-prolyl cis-trans isomerase [Pseudomonadales bacterium]|nr:FKBP-type peptidyl-prolyl cis-trans isomerase [Pseudomonadales bacterium]
MSEFTFENDAQRVSYGFGLQFGQQLIRNKFNGLNTAAVFAGIADIVESNKIQLSEEELNQAYTAIQAQMEKDRAEQAEKMAELGETFLSENAKRDGVTVTESGLQYEVLETGSGDQKPSTDSTVQVHYHGTFMDGTVFDSSVERGEPASFGVTQVIKGWTEALQLMNTGDKLRLVIPSDLAYGDAGAPPSIPGGAVLVFEVHLIDIL